MSEDRYRIAVSYNTSKHERGSLDKAAEKLAGVDEAGGGTCLVTGERDLSYYYPTLRRAENAIKRFRKDGRFLVDDEPTNVIENLW